MLDIDTLGKGFMLLFIPMGTKYFIDIILEEEMSSRRTIASLIFLVPNFFITIYTSAEFFKGIGIKELMPISVQTAIYCLGSIVYLRLWRLFQNKKFDVVRIIEQ